ncbi:methyltransferase-like protein 25B isoform X2 [Bicyclus anynana]|uniref:Methyltransferase-like protein 25B isoform X2 n=1 Tax=Bicyclus anynana TaxID=110368 RepID=A0ABM3LUS5_BICAN|nr:methyltransferase-like protein 25B isoform X2 [Bicyclus anynana]XP_052742793.1 methyltransferase-like protein 25B isoform X2 [Bicyclus anynana]
MALPSCFEGPEEYFEQFYSFLKKYEYLYNFPNTDLLVNNSLEKIEIDFEEIDVFNDFDIRNLKCEYTKDIIENLNKLGVRYEEFKEDESLEFLIDVPLSEKKKHEIAYLANEINNFCEIVECCDTIVDFGSGLGYLDEQLFKTTDYNVLGLECSETNYIAAKKRQRKYHSDSVQRVKYIKYTIKPNSHTNIQEFLNDKFPNSTGFCITGLHACADLTVDAIDIFLKMEHARALVIMPCCYHRLMSENGRFKNFPLSNTLKKTYEDHDLKYLSVPFLRLATQPPNVETEKLEDLVFNLLARAVLQVYAREHNCRLKRNKRKAVRLKSLENNFEAYVADAVNGFKLIHNENAQTEEKIVKDDLLLIWRQITPLTFKKAAMFVLLQNCMQPVFENFVLYDRLIYLKENGVDQCIFKKTVNDKISPRSLALLARK